MWGEKRGETATQNTRWRLMCFPLQGTGSCTERRLWKDLPIVSLRIPRSNFLLMALVLSQSSVLLPGTNSPMQSLRQTPTLITIKWIFFSTSVSLSSLFCLCSFVHVRAWTVGMSRCVYLASNNKNNNNNNYSTYMAP